MDVNRILISLQHFDNQIGALLNMLSTLENYDKVPIDHKTPDNVENAVHYDAVCDVLTHIILLQLDINIAFKNLCLQYDLKRNFEAGYFARALSVHICDVFMKLDDKDGLRYRLNKIVITHKNDNERKELAIALSEKIESITNEYKKYGFEINTIRKNLFAHKLKKGIEQINSINGIQVDDLALKGEALENILNETNEVLLNLLVTLR